MFLGKSDRTDASQMLFPRGLMKELSEKNTGKAFILPDLFQPSNKYFTKIIKPKAFPAKFFDDFLRVA